MCGTIHTAGRPGGHARHAVRPPGIPVRIPPIADQQGDDVTARWPLRSFLELGALPSAVAYARLHTRQLLWEWQLTGLSDDAELLVSEIVTNAIQITQADDRTAPVRIWLLADQAQVVIFVWDASPLPPVLMNGSEIEENGRGLLLVNTLSARWGYLPAVSGGKFVWVIVALTTLPCPLITRRSDGR
jgi:anti-sigma regulatory factor (Ser/Thr protein kinase)